MITTSAGGSGILRRPSRRRVNSSCRLYVGTTRQQSSSAPDWDGGMRQPKRVVIWVRRTIRSQRRANRVGVELLVAGHKDIDRKAARDIIPAGLPEAPSEVSIAQDGDNRGSDVVRVAGVDEQPVAALI